MVRRIISAAFAAVLFAGTIGAAPTAAYYWDSSSGITGYVTTSKEVVCRYNATRRLHSFTVQPPTIGGISEEPRTVAWRYQIRGAQEFSSGPLIYRSPWFRDVATVGTPTQNLSAHTKYIPLSSQIPDTTAWYARAIIVWYDTDGTTVAGRMEITYGWYLLKRGTESRNSNACAFNYDYTFGAG